MEIKLASFIFLIFDVLASFNRKSRNKSSYERGKVMVRSKVVVGGGGARVNTKDSSSPMTLPIHYAKDLFTKLVNKRRLTSHYE